MVSGTISLPCPGCFSPFPHGTGSLSVSWEYLALADGPARFSLGFSCPVILRVSSINLNITCTGLSPYIVHLSRYFQFYLYQFLTTLQPLKNLAIIQVWAPPTSLATTTGITFVFFSSGYLDVSVHRVGLHRWMLVLQTNGLSHSDTSGSKPVCGSPEFFAACRVLHRLQEPRHPPCALINFFLFTCCFFPWCQCTLCDLLDHTIK